MSRWGQQAVCDAVSNERKRAPIRANRWLAVAAVILFATGIAATREYWLREVGISLVGEESAGVSDAILVENVESNYLLFERAQRLQARGLSKTVLVPVLASERSGEPSSVSLGFVDVMCGISRLRDCTTFHAPSREPITLNLARHTAEVLRARGAHSVILVTEGFRSRRAAEIYGQVLRPLGVRLFIQPVFGQHTPDNWFKSWHGIQEVGLQLIKLWYYRVAMLSQKESRLLVR